MEFVTVNLGFDPGKRQDPGGIVVCEVKRDDKTIYTVRHIETIPLGTDHMDAVNRVLEIHANIQGMGHNVQLIVDATGIGEPVIDIMRNKGVFPLSVYLTGSDKASVTIDRAATEKWGQEIKRLSLGKSVLTSRLQVLLESGRLILPQGQNAENLVNELLNFEAGFTSKGHAKFEAGKGHDDLVIALGLAVYLEPELKRKPRYRGKVSLIAGASFYKKRRGVGLLD